MAEKVDTAAEKQRIKNVYEPEIKALQEKQSNLVNEIDRLKMKKIFLDLNVESLNETTLAFATTMLKREDEFANVSSLKGNYMEDIKCSTRSILGHGQNINNQTSKSTTDAQHIQSNLNKKIEKLQSELTTTITDVNNAIFLYQQALNSIV